MTLALIRTAKVAFPRGRDVVPFKARQVLFWFWKVHNNSKLIVLSSVAQGIPAVKNLSVEIAYLIEIFLKNTCILVETGKFPLCLASAKHTVCFWISHSIKS